MHVLENYAIFTYKKELFKGKAWLKFKSWCFKGGTGSYRCFLALMQGDANFKQARCRAEGLPKHQKKVHK
eukprot:1150743-Pelagomonas_calceolata.AAC.1